MLGNVDKIEVSKMAGMREVVGEPSLLPAMLAFGREKTSPYSSAGNLAEGFVVAKKGSSTGSFLKHHHQGFNEGSFQKDPSQIISVLVGTRDAIHKWLHMSGPARCALWIERVPLESNHEKNDLLATLELVYRQRDYQITHVQILQECKVVLSNVRQSKSKRSRTPDTSEDDHEFDWSGLRQRELEQVNYGDVNSGFGWWKGASTMRWYILMKLAAFKQLNNMLSPGGALWEFRRLLLQVVFIFFKRI